LVHDRTLADGKWLGCLAAAGLLLAFPAAGLCEDAKPSEAQASIELSTVRQQLDRSEAQTRIISGEVSSLQKEVDDLTAQLTETAERIQSREAMITAGEDRLKALDAEEASLLGELKQRRRALAELLAGLQRLERNPPPPLATYPHDAVTALRGAMLLGSIVPALKSEVAAVMQRLARLENVRAAQGAEQKEIAGHLARLATARAELAALSERKQALLAETRGRLSAERERAKQLARKAQSLQQLMDSLAADRKQAEEKRQAAVAAEARKQEEARRPHVPFSAMIGKLEFPAQGQRVREFGADDGFGGQSRGLYVATRPEAQVTAPADGDVEFAGEFRSYGQLLILNVGEGYHVLLAGLAKITAETGQTIRAGEPVGSMGNSPAGGTLIGDRLEDPRPILYIEFRKDGGAVDPTAWWVGSRKEARG
jgi:septal ring factor EnvC (AmiA/AmiB activator)